MFFLHWDHFKKDNSLIRGLLGVDKGREIDLRFDDGFFICPDDKQNRAGKLPRLRLRKSEIDFFREAYPDIVKSVETFFGYVNERFDRLDFNKFRDGAKVLYFGAAAYYAYTSKEDYKELNEFYSDKQGPKKHIERHMLHYGMKLIELMEQHGYRKSIFSFFAYARGIFTSQGVGLPSSAKQLTSFLRGGTWMPFAQKLGQAFEDAMETAFKESETRHQPQVAHLVNLWLHRRGALLQLDGNEELESLLTRKGGGKVPDYIYVTRDTIFPLELKANMRCAKPKQIYASNLRKVFQKTERVISKVFDGLTVEGRFIQKPKEEKKRKKAEKDDTPMKALSDLGVNGHDIGKVAQLWAKCVKKKKPEPITQHDLHVWGVCKTDLGLIVTIFNDKLQQVR